MFGRLPDPEKHNSKETIMRKMLISIATFAAIAAPTMALAQHATEGAAGGAAAGAVTGAVVGGPVGAAVGAGVGGTVGASVGDTNRRERRPLAERSCVTDAYGNQTCTTIRR